MNLVWGQLICLPCVEGGRFYCIISVEEHCLWLWNLYYFFLFSFVIIFIKNCWKSTVTISFFMGM